MAASLIGCGSSPARTSAVGSGSSASAQPATAATAGAPATTATAGEPARTGTAGGPTTTVANRLPTAPNCGGGAYKPATLLIVCASGDQAVMATGVTWRSWDATGAAGAGTVHVVVHGQPAARPAILSLAGVTDGGSGPQFSQLTVTWTGPSPTGSPRVSYHLQTGS
jgi:hypothetical protein